MYTLNTKDKQQFKLIGSFYGVKIRIIKTDGSGAWDGNTIIIADDGETFADIASTFFHELGHYKNWKEKRYPIYHDPKKFDSFRKYFKTYRQMIRYALNAEIVTERQGKALMKIWMPEVKYKEYYRNTRVCYEFLAGYYLGG